MRRIFGHLIFLGLAALLLFSALQHLRQSPSLVSHYRQVNLPGVNAISIGVLQMTAAVGLLLPRLNLRTAAGLSFVMSLVVLERIVRRQLDSGALVSTGIVMLCLTAIWLLRRPIAVDP